MKLWSSSAPAAAGKTSWRSLWSCLSSCPKQSSLTRLGSGSEISLATASRSARTGTFECTSTVTLSCWPVLATACINITSIFTAKPGYDPPWGKGAPGAAAYVSSHFSMNDDASSVSRSARCSADALSSPIRSLVAVSLSRSITAARNSSRTATVPCHVSASAPECSHMRW